MVNTSDITNSMYCGSNQKILDGIVAWGISSNPQSSATWSLFISVKVETIMERIEVNIPIPIL